MTQRSMIIIGAGIGGLATGVYAQRHGSSTQILEAHTAPGGVCTAWQRTDYTFEGCIHHLAGATIGISTAAINARKLVESLR